MAGSVGFNLKHVQVGVEEDEEYVWVDIAGGKNWEPAAAAESTPFMADGGEYVTAYASARGEGDLVLIDPSPAIMASVNPGEVLAYGTGNTLVDRFEVPGNYIPLPFAIADWIPNIDRYHNPATAGMRTVVPNATAAPMSRTSGQETEVEWTAAVTFRPDEDDVVVAYEWLASEPVFTNGLMPVNLTAPSTP